MYFNGSYLYLWFRIKGNCRGYYIYTNTSNITLYTYGESSSCKTLLTLTLDSNGNIPN